MSKLAQVAERIAQTRRWIEQEADRLAARLDQIEKRAPAAFQNAHRILDEQQRDLDATEQMVQQWLSASAEVSGTSNKSRVPQQAASASVRAQPKPNDGAAAPLDPVHRFLDEQQKDVGRLERALQTLATDAPEPQAAAASQPPRAQPKASNDASASLDSRRLLDDPHKDEGGLERALQSLANKLAPQPAAAASHQPAAASPLARPRLTQTSDATPPDSARRSLDEPQKGEDATPQPPRKLGVVRVA
jgi:hypothetical protein